MQRDRAGSPGGDGAPALWDDTDQRFALSHHRLAVLVPVGMLARDRTEVVDEWFQCLREVEHLGRAIDLHPCVVPLVGQHQRADRRAAPDVDRLRPLGVRGDDESSLGVDAARHW